ncbi:hypothetical protein BH23GEM6_BH23GEM6_04340 [soil metagenome]
MNQAMSSARPARSRDATAEPIHRPPYVQALIAGVLVFMLYALTLAPTTHFWDTSEYIATAHILGIPHPPGNPLFVLMARAWELLLSPTGLSVAVRVNLFSALMSAGAATFWFLVVHRILTVFSPSETVRRVGAGAAVLLSATAFTVWSQSNVNEKVYTVSLFTIALLSWVMFLWRDHVEEHRGVQGGRWHDDNAIVFVVFVLALSVANHLMAFLAAPAIVFLIFLVKPHVFVNWRIYAWSTLFLVIGLSVHLYLPIRAGLNPLINEADPTCASLGEALVSVLTFGNAGCADLSAALAREQYAKPPVTERLAPFWAQMANYFQYFDWQWSRSLMGNFGYFAPARIPFTILFLALGGYGAVQHWRRDRISFAYIGTLFATLSVGLVFYLNFKYGFNQMQAMGLPFDLAEVRERDYFFLVSFSMWGLWAGIGLTTLWLRFTENFCGREKASLMASPVMLVALLPLFLNWPYASRAGDYSARDWAYNLLQSVEPYGVLFTNGDNDTFPLWYLQEVEGIRRDVTVMVWSYLNTPWYVKQIRDLTEPCATPGDAEMDRTRIICQRVFDPAGAPAFYTEATYPTRTILPLTDADIDQATSFGFVQLPQNVVFEARGIQAQLAAGTFLPAADQFVLSIIRAAWGDRPVYFAATTNVHRKLGLDRFTARQGVAFKLITPEESQAEGMIPMPQDQSIYGAFVDLPRSEALLWEQFIHRDLITRRHWTDDATRGIPTYYAYAHFSVAQARQLLGDETQVNRNLDRYERWMELSER